MGNRYHSYVTKELRRM